VGSQVVDTDKEASHYGFNLTVVNAAARNGAYRSVCVDVSNLFFEDPPQGCGGAPPIYSHAAAQRFERGLMIWIEEVDMFFVLLDDHNSRYFSGPLELLPGASVDNRVGGAPPGFYEPISGFGLLWRGEVKRSRDLREWLGWAVQPEFGFDTVYQRGLEGNWNTSRYMRNADGNVIHVRSAAYVLPLGWEYVPFP
jgi:hypothetical protein